MTGCQTFQERLPKVNKETLTFWKKKEITDGSNAKKNDRVVVGECRVWGLKLGAKRGLGGRLYFYDEDQKPTKIEGAACRLRI